MNLGACAHLPLAPLTGTWFRAIQPQHWPTALNTAHSRTWPGRFNAGSLSSPGFEVLYLAENALVALLETSALFGTPTTPGAILSHPHQAWITVNVEVQLQSAIDLADVASQLAIASTAQELTGDWRGYQLRSAMTSGVCPDGNGAYPRVGSGVARRRWPGRISDAIGKAALPPQSHRVSAEAGVKQLCQIHQHSDGAASHDSLKSETGDTVMPEIRRSATMSIDQGIDLPMSPPIVIGGRGTDGKAVYRMQINATVVVIAGPKGGVICNLYWDQLVDLAKTWN